MRLNIYRSPRLTPLFSGRGNSPASNHKNCAARAPVQPLIRRPGQLWLFLDLIGDAAAGVRIDIDRKLLGIGTIVNPSAVLAGCSFHQAALQAWMEMRFDKVDER